MPCAALSSRCCSSHPYTLGRVVCFSFFVVALYHTGDTVTSIAFAMCFVWSLTGKVEKVLWLAVVVEISPLAGG